MLFVHARRAMNVHCNAVAPLSRYGPVPRTGLAMGDFLTHVTFYRDSGSPRETGRALATAREQGNGPCHVPITGNDLT